MTTPPSHVALTGLEPSDLDACAALHEAAFPGFFLSALGPQFLKEFYRGFMDDADAIAVVARAQTDGRLLGVVVGTLHPDGFFGRLVKRRWRAFLLSALRALLRRPKALPRLVRALWYRGELPIATHGALLSSICVDPASQGAGVGRQLLHAWTDRITVRGAVAAYLTTDRIDNHSTNRFYLQAGWTATGSFTTREGREMNCYVWGSNSPRIEEPRS